MKAYTISGADMVEGIEISMAPYPHVVLGEGGHKRATWVALGKRDADTIARSRRLPCPNRGQTHYGTLVGDELPVCQKCGERYTQDPTPRHLNSGEVDGPACISDVGVIALKDGEGKQNNKYLIVAPRGDDNRVLVLWRVGSGYRGGASISAGEGVAVIARDSSWHSGRGNLGETAEILAILKPGQELHASRSGRRVQDTCGRLAYDGKKLSITFGGEEMEAATTEDVEGEYI